MLGLELLFAEEHPHKNKKEIKAKKNRIKLLRFILPPVVY